MAKSWSKDLVLDSHTFGNSKACEVLADMMNQNVISTFEKHRVLSFITTANVCAKDLCELKNRGLLERTNSLLKNDFLVKISEMPYPLKFNTHLKNVICYIFRSERFPR